MSTDALLALLSAHPSLSRADLLTASLPLQAVLQELTEHQVSHDTTLQKNVDLRRSLSHLTSRTEHLSTQIVDAGVVSSAQRASHRKAVEKLEVENDGLRALLCVWEGRWRERTRLSEEADAMGHVRNGTETRVDPGGGFSILDVASVRATAARSSSARTAALEAEVRALELEVEKRVGIKRPEVLRPSAKLDQMALAETVSQLNDELETLRLQLSEVTNERERLLEAANETSSISTNNIHPFDLASLERITVLTAERDEYSRLLEICHSEITDLSARLSASQSQLEVLSDRVRIKLEEQKAKISAYHTRITELTLALQESESAHGVV